MVSDDKNLVALVHDVSKFPVVPLSYVDFFALEVGEVARRFWKSSPIYPSPSDFIV